MGNHKAHPATAIYPRGMRVTNLIRLAMVINMLSFPPTRAHLTGSRSQQTAKPEQKTGGSIGAVY
jgi:hypothetical protein